MRAHHLELTDFRNYIRQELDFGDGVNVIYGDNAQGKTNILEAVFFFAMGKSNRARRDAELIRHGADEAKICLKFSDSERENVLEAEFFRGMRKKISANEVLLRKNSELIRRFNVVYFGPEYMSLVKDGPGVRRRNLDILISQIKPGYVSALGELKKIIDSKNALLRMENPNLTMLEIMNDKLAAVSANIIANRMTYLDKIKLYAAEIQDDISGGCEKLEVKYKSCIGDTANMSVEEIEKAVRLKIDESQKREIRICEAVVGPHREDVEYTVNGYDAKLYASQGQQKTIVMAQKLAEVKLLFDETGEMPVLLLDDIMSELDKSRREYILKAVKDIQILITCTDTDGMDVPSDARRIRVHDGNAEVVS